MATTLIVFKLLGVISSAVFGVLGTMHEFRYADGKLTKWGRVAITGTIASVFVAVSAQLLENHLQSISAREASLQALESTQRLEKIVSQLNRAVQPIESVSAYIANLGVPMDHALLGQYKRRLDNGIDRALRVHPGKTVLGSDPLPHRLRFLSGEPGFPMPTELTENGVNTPEDVRVTSLSDLFPQYESERLPSLILTVSQIELAFYKKAIDPKRFYPFSDGYGAAPDLRVYRSNREPLDIRKSLKEGTFNLWGLLESERASWEDASGRIIAIPDLAGVQLFIAFGPPGIGVEGINEAFLKVRQEFSLNSMNIQFGNRNRWIRSSEFKKHINAEGQTFWEFVFPASPDKLFAVRG